MAELVVAVVAVWLQLTSYLQGFFTNPNSNSVLATRCASLIDTFSYEDAAIISAHHIDARTNLTIPNTCGVSTAVIGDSSVCRIELVVNTTATSQVKLEAWLPDVWYGRLLGLGNGGLGGCIAYGNLAYGTSLKFASISSNNGHDGYDGKVFLDNPEVINDFAYRSINVEALVGKALVESYYGRKHDKTYYLGCSTGGRQGIRTAEKYPDLFDGILAGAPAVDWNHLLGWSALLAKLTGAPNNPESESYVRSTQWEAISREILRQCDKLDGVEDGVITEPDDCHFNPEVLLCSANNQLDKSECLTPQQVRVVQSVYSPVYGKYNELIYPRFEPGAESDGGWKPVFGGGLPPTANNWFKYAIYNDSNYDISDFSVKDIYYADSVNPGGISTWSGDLTRFRAKGGKIITYHGRMDALIPATNSKRLFNHISDTMKLPSLDDFYRLFLIPGMYHCSGGPGAWAFGQYLPDAQVVNASTYNALLALVEWVENEVAPDTLIGSVPGDASASRIHCRYPQRSVRGSNAWVCQQ